MNLAHLHLLLNQIPVLGTVFGFGLLLFGLIRKSDDVVKASLGLFVIAALVAVPVYLTGEPAEEVVEHTAGVAESIIEQHEESALLSLIAMEALGVLALGWLFLSRRARQIPTWFAGAFLILSVVTGGLMAQTANLGGQIRHAEIRTAVASAPQTEDEEDEGSINLLPWTDEHEAGEYD